MLEIIDKNYDSKVKRLISENGIKINTEIFMFNREKSIKRIMQLEGELFMPKHIPKGTPEDPDNPDFREFSQYEKDNCKCSNCKFPVSEKLLVKVPLSGTLSSINKLP